MRSGLRINGFSIRAKQKVKDGITLWTPLSEDPARSRPSLTFVILSEAKDLCIPPSAPLIHEYAQAFTSP